jgi:UPF0176 protein
LARIRTLRGTFLVTAEGINLFCAGEPHDVRAALTVCQDVLPDFAGTVLKESWSPDNPFRKLIIKTRREAISLGAPNINPAQATGPRLSPQTVKEWLDRPKREFLLVDTRNDYEVALGTFEGAINPHIKTFRDFPDWCRKNLAEHKNTPIVTFCTGGIRCEKATALMQQEGFTQVYQIDGGILGYLEATKDQPSTNHWQGHCFVFDHRVAVDNHLAPTGHVMCFACWHVLTPEDEQDPRTQKGVSCPYCFEDQKKKTDLREEQRRQRQRERLERSRERGLAAQKAYRERLGHAEG